MRKTDKKMDNNICRVLTDVCENVLKEYVGFQWLTHLVNYSDFPKSLKIICVFDTNENLARFLEGDASQDLRKTMHAKLLPIGVKVNDLGSQIHYDTEENCDLKNNGNWADRLHN